MTETSAPTRTGLCGKHAELAAILDLIAGGAWRAAEVTRDDFALAPPAAEGGD